MMLTKLVAGLCPGACVDNPAERAVGYQVRPRGHDNGSADGDAGHLAIAMTSHHGWL